MKQRTVQKLYQTAVRKRRGLVPWPRRICDFLADSQPLVALLSGVVLGAAPISAQALSTADFTNSATIGASTDQYEPGLSNNQSQVLVLPKGMQVTKTADASALSSPTAAGDIITYTITVTNLGLLGLTNVQPADSIIPPANVVLSSGDLNGDNILDANEVWEYTGTYAVTQIDLDSNGGGDADIDNTVTVTSDELPPMDAEAEVPIIQAPAFTVAKVVDAGAIAIPGALNYTITVTNAGNLTLNNVTLNDVLPDGSSATLSGPATDTGIVAALDVGEVWTYTTTYNVSQSDIDAGSVLTNTVTVTADETGSDSQTATADTLVNTAPEMVLSKTVDQSTVSAPGTLTYVVTVENTGNVTLTGVAPVDTLPDGTTGTLTGPVADTGTAGAIDVGETWTYGLTYAVSQAEIDTGNALVNAVVANSNETGATVYNASAETTVVSEPDFVVDKVVDLAAISAPGTVSYTITVENTGNTTLTNIVLNDLLPDGSAATLAGPTGDAGIASAIDVGETWQYTTTYNVVQADIDAGNDLINTVSVSADETGAPKTATATTTVNEAPSVSIVKTVDQSLVNAPGTLTYTIEVENIGNVTLTNVSLVDSLPDGTPAVLTGPVADTGVAGGIDVGETWVYSSTYAVSQAEIDAGNTLTNSIVVVSDQTPDPVGDTAVTTIDRAPSFSLEKTVDQASIDEPSVLNYTITLTNTGNVSLTNVGLVDTLPDGSAAVLLGPTGDLSQADIVDVGESWTWTTTYSASQSELDAGELLTNTVVASTQEAGSAEDTAVTSVSQAPQISIAKSTSTADYTAIGDVINYTLTVTNTGNVVLETLQVNDPIADAGSIACPAAQLLQLLPAEQMTCTAMHTVVQSDIDNTQVDNQASVTSVDPQGNVIEDDSDVVTVTMTRVPPVATNNQFVSPVSAVPVTLAAASDDSDANGDLDVTTLSLVHPLATDSDGDGDLDALIVPGEGTWQVNNATGDVTFTPQAGFTADPTPVPYTITDATGLVSNQALLTIDYPQTAPTAQNDFKANTGVPSPANPTTLNLLADNGSGPDSDPENDLVIQSINLLDPAATDTDNDGDADSLQVAGEGTWVLNNATGDITFTPEPGFSLTPHRLPIKSATLTGWYRMLRR